MGKPKMKKEIEFNNGQAVIKNGRIVISCQISALKSAVAGACDLWTIDGDFKVTNPKLFALEVVRELNAEDEDGTTLVHKMFDAAFNEVIDQGGMGIEAGFDEEEE